MADKQIRIGLFADDNASAALDRVGSAAQSAGGKLKTADSAARETGNGLDRAGEGADNAETKLIGVHDVIDGTATIMQGPGKAGMTAYVQGWADLAGGVAPLLPSLSAFRLSNIRATASTVASTVASRAAAVGAKVWAAGQWVLNAALSANPIGLVIVGIVALAAVFIIAYKRSETFRRIVQGALGGVRAVASSVAGFFTGPFASGFRWVFGVVGAYVGAWRSVMVGAVHGVQSAFSGVANAISGPFYSAFGGIRSAWNSTLGGKGFDMPSWVPGLGGKGFHIPYLARGGIVTRPTLAMVGEAGPEAVVPLGRGGGGFGGPSEVLAPIQLVVDGKMLQTVLLRVKRDNGGASLGLA